MGFLLRRDGWRDVGHNRSACGVFVLEIALAGERRFYATRAMDVREFPGGPLVRCVPAVLNSPAFVQSVDPYSRQFNVNEVQFTLMTAQFPIAQLSRSGQDTAQIQARVHWMVAGMEFDLDQAFLLVDGLVTGLQYSEESDRVSFSVVDNQLAGDRRFPPHAVTIETFAPAAVPAESFGKSYPVVIGSVKKLPLINISTDKTRFLVMDDPASQFSGALVSAIYDVDTTRAKDSEGSGTDLRGNNYYYVDITGDAATSEDVTADVDNGIDGGLADAIFYLLTCYSSKTDIFDMASLMKVRDEFLAAKLSIVFNTPSDEGVVQVVKERLIKQFPITIVQRGKKFYFQSLLWDRDVCKVLSTDTNIVGVVSEPSEVDRSLLANEFVVSAGTSGLRGESTSAVVRNKDNDAICLTSKSRYGELGRKEISAADLEDSEGATWLMNWTVLTFALKRVRVSYLCTLDGVDVNLWDTVQVYDRYQGWTHGPLFKVVGIQLGEASGVIVHLLSLDDWFDVYCVNRKPYESLELLGAEWI